jgi:hypothetical protein
MTEFVVGVADPIRYSLPLMAHLLRLISYGYGESGHYFYRTQPPVKYVLH